MAIDYELVGPEYHSGLPRKAKIYLVVNLHYTISVQKLTMAGYPPFRQLSFPYLS